MLAALEAVDLVVVFEPDTPLDLIKRVRPAVLVKGADYRREEVVGREVVEAAGGDVILVDLVPYMQHHEDRAAFARINIAMSAAASAQLLPVLRVLERETMAC